MPAQLHLQSGAFDNYTVQMDCKVSFTTFAKAAGCAPPNATTRGDDAALACLRAKPLRVLSAPGEGLMRAVAYTSHAGLFSPCVDGVRGPSTICCITHPVLLLPKYLLHILSHQVLIDQRCLISDAIVTMVCMPT